MDRLESYRDIVCQLVERYAGYGCADGQIATEAVIDRQRDHYQVIDVGWEGHHRVHTCVIHIDIRGGKVWLQHNATNRLIAEELIEAGIPREDIVLGFHPPDVRRYTEFAVG